MIPHQSSGSKFQPTGRKELIRVGVLTNIPSPYRSALFRRLAVRHRVSLNVAFNALTEENRHWKVPQEEAGFSSTILGGKSLSIAAGTSTFHVNTGVRKWISDNKLEVVILAGWSQPSQIIALCHCHSKGIPVVFWSGSIEGNASIFRRFSRIAMRLFIRRASAYIAYGSMAADYLIGLGALPSRIYKAFNTVDINSWQTRARDIDRVEAREALQLSEEVTFLYVGQLIDRKGILDLVEAVCDMRVQQGQVKLLVAGLGPLEDTLREMIKQHKDGSRILLLGHVPEDDLAAFYTACDVVVLPSTYEVWGLVLNEGMALGKPAITTSSVGASRDLIIHGENGWVIPAGDTKSLRIQLEECVTMGTSALQKSGQRARITVSERFNLDVAAAAIEDAVQSVVHRL